MSTPVIDDAGVGSSPVPDKPARATGPQGAETSRQPKSARRITFIKWLRKVHGWIGLWGAALGLLFGTTGFLLNHRGGPLRVSTGEPVVSTVQVPLPQPAPETPRELAKWLKQELKLAGKPGRMQNEPAHRVAWGERSMMQPEHWEISFASPHENAAADYWVGNDFVTVKRTENAFFATLTNLHKGVGMSVGWVLVVDTLAGSLILLSLTGVLLWTELNRRKTVGAVLVIGCIVTMLCAGLL
ncbi:hypothetical protein P3T24_005742 [Paraburkholderia sp. GAS33]|uniref:PepSY-associated TM helix domain-containing protein n=1 Tax=Paraburkholderia sp. GAS33 TaxID=3035130 RepID=UPI003D1CAB6C